MKPPSKGSLMLSIQYLVIQVCRPPLLAVLALSLSLSLPPCLVRSLYPPYFSFSRSLVCGRRCRLGVLSSLQDRQPEQQFSFTSVSGILALLLRDSIVLLFALLLLLELLLLGALLLVVRRLCCCLLGFDFFHHFFHDVILLL